MIGRRARERAAVSRAQPLRGELRLTVTDPVSEVSVAFAFPPVPTSFERGVRGGRVEELRLTEGRPAGGDRQLTDRDAGVLEERVTRAPDGALEGYVATWSVPDPRRPGRRRCVCQVHVDGLPAPAPEPAARRTPLHVHAGDASR